MSHKNIFTKALDKIKHIAGFFKPLNYIQYWEKRYLQHGNSGLGSMNDLRVFKTDFINQFIEHHHLSSLVDFGCGDGQQIKDIKIEKYLGLDVSPAAIGLCQNLYGQDKSKSFLLYHPASFFNNGFIKTDLVMCLDVLYHVIDENDFKKTLQDIFSCANDFVILYTNTQLFEYSRHSHVLYRDPFPYLSAFSDFAVLEIEKQKYQQQSGADFIVLQRKK